jgi:hypothetical protein
MIAFVQSRKSPIQTQNLTVMRVPGNNCDNSSLSDNVSIDQIVLEQSEHSFASQAVDAGNGSAGGKNSKLSLN